MRRGFTKRDELVPAGTPKLLQLYHVKWGRQRGVVGRCKSIDEINKTVTMVSPITKVQWKNPVKWEDLLLTRKHQAKLNQLKS